MSEISFIHERRLLASALESFYSRGGDAHGNVSIRVDRLMFLMKPSGLKVVDSDQLLLIRIVAFGGTELPTVEVREGTLKPSVDTQHHAQIYVNNDWIRSICHTHSDYVVAHAAACKPITCITTEQADIFGGTIDCEHYEDLDSWSKGLEIGEKGVHARLLGQHGGLTFAQNPAKAVELAKRMEDIARKNYLAHTLQASCCGIPPLQEREVKKWRDRYIKSYGQKK